MVKIEDDKYDIHGFLFCDPTFDEYFCVPCSQIIDLIGLDIIKKATDITNQAVFSEWKKFREEKDAELVNRESGHTR